MQPQTLNCPMCGAPAANDSTKCQHCGARLATVSCPACFTMMFRGAKFCPNCGAEADRHEAGASADPGSCPRCRVAMSRVTVGETAMRECPKCEGLWLDRVAFEALCARQEEQAAVLERASPALVPSRDLLGEIRYVPCPECHQLMNRLNFADCSGVVIDVCRPHGVWFDRDELARIVQFLRSGGLERSRANKMAELQEQERRLRSLRQFSSFGGPVEADDSRTIALTAAAQLLRGILRD